MFRLIEALNFRCLRYVRQPLGPFHVLVGPNASGKTTFLDVIEFLGTLVSKGPEEAVWERSQNFQDLVWHRESGPFELAVEAEIPADRRVSLQNPHLDIIRYEVRLGLDPDSQEIGILDEQVLLKQEGSPSVRRTSVFPMLPEVPTTVIAPDAPENTQQVVGKRWRGFDPMQGSLRKLGVLGSELAGRPWKASDRVDATAHSELGEDGHFFPLGLGRDKSVLAALPEDEMRFPASLWLRSLLSHSVQPIVLSSQSLRKPSPPGQRKGFRPDGSNLPWVVSELERPENRERMEGWISHLQTALPELRGIRTVERPEDRHRYMVLEYAGGLSVPSWMASDGTLRLLALTLPAYLPKFEGVYLIEEPENGIHPLAVETMFQSLSSVYGAQILMATHSPIILSIADPDTVLCFKKNNDGATDIVRGSEHPALRDWQGETNLGTLFAAGVLG